MCKRLTIPEAEAQGFTIDTTVYCDGHYGYKGLRFDNFAENVRVYTELEGELLAACEFAASVMRAQGLYDASEKMAVAKLDAAIAKARRQVADNG